MKKDNSQIKLLYIAYSDPNFIKSGSGIRPKRMLEAFEKLGYNVIKFYAEQHRGEFNERKKIIKKIERIVFSEKIDLCYIESSTYPILLHADRKLIKTIHNQGIPIGYFYRDFYRKFPNLFPRRKGFINFLKETWLDLMQLLTDRILRYCDIIYLPSKSCKELFSYKDMRELPPAGRELHLSHNTDIFTGIYVGGLTGTYNGEFILEVFNELFNRNKLYNLILVCRENEFNKISNNYNNCQWLNVFHASGEELLELYDKASFAIAAQRKDYIYNRYSISVKTFEYMEHGLPQVVVNNKSIKEFIEKEIVGIAANEDVNEFADAVQYLVENPGVYNKYRDNVKESLLKRNLWNHRVETIVTDLLNTKKISEKDL